MVTEIDSSWENQRLIEELELLRMQKADAFETLADEREKYEELDKICRAQHEAINQCADHLREAQLALMAFIDAKADIYEESRKRAKARKRISNAELRGAKPIGEASSSNDVLGAVRPGKD